MDLHCGRTGHLLHESDRYIFIISFSFLFFLYTSFMDVREVGNVSVGVIHFLYILNRLCSHMRVFLSSVCLHEYTSPLHLFSFPSLHLQTELNISLSCPLSFPLCPFSFLFFSFPFLSAVTFLFRTRAPEVQL